MNPRPTLIDKPESARWWTVDTTGPLGTALLRLPTYADAARIAEAMQAAADNGSRLMAGCAAVGLCWRHRSLALDAADTSDLLAFGNAVLDELQDYDVPWADIQTLVGSVSERIGSMFAVAEDAKATAGFSELTPAGSTDSPSRSEPSTSADPSASTT